MATNLELETALRAWTPELEDNLNSTEYLGSESYIGWLNDSEWSLELERATHKDGYSTAITTWTKVLGESISLPTPALLLILEQLRKNPSQTASCLEKVGLNFTKTLPNVAFRAADSLFDSARNSFAMDEFDVAIARLRIAISEFRFSIESDQLSEKTRKIATGKYAAAIAMIGRWTDVPYDVIERALLYSRESIALGNLNREALFYRLELLILQFDQTGNQEHLQEALELLAGHDEIAFEPELIHAEVYFRLALTSDNGPKSRRHLSRAANKLSSFRPRTGVEQVRSSILSTLVSEVTRKRIEIPVWSISFPRGLLILMAKRPSAQLWGSTRNIIKGLETLRRDRELIPAAIFSTRLLRQMIDGPDNLVESADIDSYVQATDWLSRKVPWNRHIQWEAGAAALSAAERTEGKAMAQRSLQIFESLAASHATWPLPRIGIARVQDYLECNVQDGHAYTANHWRNAAELALNSSAYARSNLGGRNQVFAVTDARGFLSETFVFKRTTKANAEHEASMMTTLRNEIVRLGDETRYAVPRSLAIVEVVSEDECNWVHVSQRAVGRLVSELRPDEVSLVLEPIVDLLSIFHSVAGQPDYGRSAWRPLKNHIKMWAKTLFEPKQADHFVKSLREFFPENLPLVRKRDGHASNWLVDPAGRVVAIDLESREFLPFGYDVAQLIEDNALIQANQEGWSRRLEIFDRYAEHMEVELSDEALGTAYAWFALTRALRLGTEREAGKQLRRHAREVCRMLSDMQDGEIKEVAEVLLQALSRIEQAKLSVSVVNHDHRRLSKAMAYQLRHSGPASGIGMDKSGFVDLDDLALVLKVDSSHLLAVAEHPGEPRFQVRDGRIRALYGHSLDVVVDPGVGVGGPTCLFHGSSWEVLDRVLQSGLIPMQRRMVHLTNNAAEAVAVGARKGAPVVIAIEQSGEEQPVAEGIWVVPHVLPEQLSIINPFLNEAGSSK